jgi:Family of unknown function (DUF6160)
MKGLNKIALVSAIAAASFGAQAELKALDDSAMGELTGQAGLTIDIETKWTMGEFAYQDAGFVVLKDLSMGGNSNEAASPFFAAHGGFLDNIRLTLDVAGAGAAGSDPTDNISSYGMSEVKHLAAKHIDAGSADATGEFQDAADGAVAGATMFQGLSSYKGDTIDDERISGDGDLTLHFGFTDAWQKGGGYLAYAAGLGSDGLGGQTDLAGLGFEQAVEILKQSVDFEFNIGQIALASSSYDVGNGVIEKTAHGDFSDPLNPIYNGVDATPETTTLISDLSVKGYLGPMDIIIENKGNGFSGGAANGGVGTGNADSKILWDSYFKVTDLDLYIDIAGVQLTDIQIHNDRGDTTGLNVSNNGSNTGSLGFAHSKREIYAVKDDILNGGLVDGIAIDTRFKGDIDIGAISFGDTGKSVGKIFMTDIQSTTNWRISAH